MERVPRSPDSSKNVIIDGMAWDRIASILEKFANLSVSAPLQMQDVPGGRALSINIPSPAVRMKVKTAVNSDGIAICNLWNGTTADIADIAVRVYSVGVVNQELFASKVAPFTGVTYTSQPVVWFEQLDLSTIIPVTIQKTGGSNGNKTTAASWVYTVKDVTGTFTLGTSVALAKPRPLGTATFQSGSSGYGLAFWKGTSIILYDAGEVYGTGSC